MDQNHFNTDEAVRKSGSHLTLAERGMIQALHKEGMSLRGINSSFLFFIYITRSIISIIGIYNATRNL